jgi:hypothetical protein
VKLDIRNGIKKIVKHGTYHNNRVTENHREQVIKILREKNCYYAVVIMDKEKYVGGMQQLIDDGLYELKTSNPLTRTVQAAKNMIQEVVGTMNLSSCCRYKLKVSNPQISLLYDLPKTRKQGNKMQQITLNVGSLFVNLCRLLNELRHIEVPIDFIQEVKDMQDDEIFLFFDVVSQFPSISIDLSPQHMKKCLTTRRIDSQNFLLCQRDEAMHERKLFSCSRTRKNN